MGQNKLEGFENFFACISPKYWSRNSFILIAKSKKNHPEMWKLIWGQKLARVSPKVRCYCPFFYSLALNWSPTSRFIHRKEITILFKWLITSFPPQIRPFFLFVFLWPITIDHCIVSQKKYLVQQVTNIWTIKSLDILLYIDKIAKKSIFRIKIGHFWESPLLILTW